MAAMEAVFKRFGRRHSLRPGGIALRRASESGRVEWFAGALCARRHTVLHVGFGVNTGAVRHRLWSPGLSARNGVCWKLEAAYRVWSRRA